MSQSWADSDRYEARLAACPGHKFEERTRDEQQRTHEFRPWRCSECAGMFNNDEKRAYEQGFRNGWDERRATLLIPCPTCECCSKLLEPDAVVRCVDCAAPGHLRPCAVADDRKPCDEAAELAEALT